MFPLGVYIVVPSLLPPAPPAPPASCCYLLHPAPPATTFIYACPEGAIIFHEVEPSEWVPDRVPICTKCIEAHEVWPIILAEIILYINGCPRGHPYALRAFRSRRKRKNPAADIGLDRDNFGQNCDMLHAHTRTRAHAHTRTRAHALKDRDL